MTTTKKKVGRDKNEKRESDQFLLKKIDRKRIFKGSRIRWHNGNLFNQLF